MPLRPWCASSCLTRHTTCHTVGAGHVPPAGQMARPTQRGEQVNTGYWVLVGALWLAVAVMWVMAALKPSALTMRRPFWRVIRVGQPASVTLLALCATLSGLSLEHRELLGLPPGALSLLDLIVVGLALIVIVGVTCLYMFGLSNEGQASRLSPPLHESASRPDGDRGVS